MKVAFVYRAISYLLNLNKLQDLKFDITYDNGVSLQTIVVYIKFPKEVLLLVGANGPFYPNFAPAAASAGVHFFKILQVGYI